MQSKAASQGEAYAREARRLGFFGDITLSAIQAYYTNEGARDPSTPQVVLSRLGGLTPLEVAIVLGERAALAGQRFNERLTILEAIGEGGMGVVYRAFDHILERVVALKVVLPERLEGRRAAVHLKRFAREAKLMARVRHPACVGIHDVGISARGEPFVVLEFVRGQSLREAIAETEGHLDPQEVAVWGADLAEGLQACHDAGVLHRDVKPANVLLDERRRARLTDFGIAFDELDAERLTRTGAAIGTVAYMAPEQLHGEATVATDVYGLGAALYHALTGRTPFPGSGPEALRAIALDRPRPLRELRPEVPRALERVVLRCLAKSVQDRYPSALAVSAALRAKDSPPAPQQPVAPPRRRSRLALAAIAYGSFASVGLGWSLWRAHSLDAQRETDRRQALAREAGLRARHTDSQRSVEAARVRIATLERDLSEADSDRERMISERDRLSAEIAEIRRPGKLIPLGGSEYLNAKDGSTLIWIPPGSFVMGNRHHAPPHRVEFERGFFIGKFEVTWKQFRAFCEATQRDPPDSALYVEKVLPEMLEDPLASGVESPFHPPENHPVFRVNWADAVAYTSWAGLRLPTEAEWEYSALGTTGWRFPWGNGWLVGGRRVANVRGQVLAEDEPWYRMTGVRPNDGAFFTAPVNAFVEGASPFGCLGMAGNVQEWVSDWFAPHQPGLQRDPQGPTSGNERIVKGSAYYLAVLGAKTRFGIPPVVRHPSVGFRVARSAP